MNNKKYVYVIEVCGGEIDNWAWKMVDIYDTYDKALATTTKYEFIRRTEEDEYHEECEYYKGITCYIKIRRKEVK